MAQATDTDYYTIVQIPTERQWVRPQPWVPKPQPFVPQPQPDWLPIDETTKKAFDGTTHVAFVLDKSGSMLRLQAQAINGFNQWKRKMLAVPNAYSFTLTLFDTAFTTPLSNADLRYVADLDYTTYVAGGWTALYDAVGDAVVKMEPNVKEGDRVLVIILTDGKENSSKRYDAESLQALIKEHEARGNWTFTYLSSSRTYLEDAARIGTQVENTMNFVASEEGTAAAFTLVGENSAEYARTPLASTSSFYSKTA